MDKIASTATNILGADGIIGRDAQNEIGWFVNNGHRDVIQARKADGTILGSYDYDAWGNATFSDSEWDNPIRYAGEYLDEESGLIYLRARYYDSSVGRFISEDTHWTTDNMIYGDTNNTGIPNLAVIMQSSNLYVYCRNNPINLIDFTGNYDREAAVKYAIKWAYDTNSSQYERFDTTLAFVTSFGRMRGDCANFVSQCLVAGGLKMNSSWHYKMNKIEEWHGNNSVIHNERDMTAAWASAAGQYQFFSSDWAGYKNGEVLQIWTNQGMEYNIKYNNIQAGDIMFFADKDTRIAHHATIITKVDDKDIYYSAHTGPRKDEPLSNGHLDDEMVFVVRIRDEAINGYTK